MNNGIYQLNENGMIELEVYIDTGMSTGDYKPEEIVEIDPAELEGKTDKKNESVFEEIARDVFFSKCTYSWCIKGEEDE